MSNPIESNLNLANINDVSINWKIYASSIENINNLSFTFKSDNINFDSSLVKINDLSVNNIEVSNNITVLGDLKIKNLDISSQINENKKLINYISKNLNDHFIFQDNDLTIENNLVVSGSLTVDGSSHIVNSINYYIEDPIFTIGKISGEQTQEHLPQTRSYDRGIEIIYQPHSVDISKTAFIGMLTSDKHNGSNLYNRFVLAENCEISNNEIILNSISFGNLVLKSLDISGGHLKVDGSDVAIRYEVDASFALYATRNEIDSSLSLYVTREQVDSSLSLYVTREQVDNSLSLYVTREQVDSSLSLYLTRIEVDNSSIAFSSTNNIINLVQTDISKNNLIKTNKNKIFGNESLDFRSDKISVKEINVNKINASELDFTNLGTIDPNIRGRLYNEGGYLKISSG